MPSTFRIGNRGAAEALPDSGPPRGKNSSFAQKACTFALVALLLLAGLAPAVAGAQQAGHGRSAKAALNPEFAVYQQLHGGQRQTGQALGTVNIENGAGSTGLKPHPVGLSHLAGKRLSDTIARDGKSGAAAVSDPANGALPASYDLRQQGKVTGVRDQGSSGSCWAFGTLASLESFLLPAEAADFSENNLKNTHGFDWGPNDGGNGFISVAALTRWTGPVNETADPYDPLSTASPVLPPAKHVQDVYFIPPRSGSLDNANAKAALLAYGALYVTYYADGSSEYYNSRNSSYYYTGRQWPNHAVAIVGWDDSYSRFNFSATPAGDGAFIVKNSWGTGWGDGGYFYVSYYDTVFGKDQGDGLMAFTAGPADNFDHVYQHDWYGLTENWGFGSDTAYFAANYTATGRQVLEAAGFYVAQASSDYTVKVYVDGALEQTSSGTIGVPGYRTVHLDDGVPVEAGQAFRVEVRLRTPGFDYPVPIESRYDGYDSGAAANVSESFFSGDGVAWYDTVTDAPGGAAPDADVCLKAYASDEGLFEFSQPAYTASESDGAATITVTRDVAGWPASVNYSAGPGTATARDFTPGSGTLHFGAGETSKSFSVPITGDLLLEGPETVALALSGATNLSQIGSQGNAALTIADTQTPPAVIPAQLAFAASEKDGSLGVIDVSNGTVLARLDAGEAPYGVAVSPGGAFAYATDNATGKLWQIDARNLSRLRSVQVGSQPHGLAICPDGSTAAVALSGEGEVALVDLRSMAVLRRAGVGSGPEAAAFSPDGSLVYVTNRDSGDVSVVNAESGQTSTVSAGVGPTGVCAAPDGRVYVANSGSANLTVLGTDGSTASIPLAGQPGDIRITPDGTRACVAFPEADRLGIIGLWSGDIVSQVAVPAPGSLAVAPDGQALYAAEVRGCNITAIHVQDGTVTGTIRATNNTTGLAFGPAYQPPETEFASSTFAVNHDDGNLTVTLNRRGCLDRPANLSLAASGGNASAGVDYGALPGQVLFAPGQSVAAFNVTLASGAAGYRTLELSLSSPDSSTAIGANATAAGSISDRLITVSYHLNPGWNLLSLPVTPQNTSLTSVLPPEVMPHVRIVWYLDNSNPGAPTWKAYRPTQSTNTLTELRDGMGFWIKAYNETDFRVTGTVPASGDVVLNQGWNMVGSRDLSTHTPAELYGSYYITWGYDSGTWYSYKPSRSTNTLAEIKPGSGYYVKIK